MIILIISLTGAAPTSGAAALCATRPSESARLGWTLRAVRATMHTTSAATEMGASAQLHAPSCMRCQWAASRQGGCCQLLYHDAASRVVHAGPAAQAHQALSCMPGMLACRQVTVRGSPNQRLGGFQKTIGFVSETVFFLAHADWQNGESVLSAGGCTRFFYVCIAKQRFESYLGEEGPLATEKRRRTSPEGTVLY